MLVLKRFLAAVGVLLALAAAPPAFAVTLTYEVGPMDNLYFTAWGHPFGSALGTGVAAGSVESGAPFDFSPFASISVSATGCIVDDGPSCTGPDGLGGLFRGLTVYSMIGLWSTTSGAITSLSGPFVVGSAAVLAVPGGGPAYLFLAENDGIFSDNTSGSYDVTIEAVPEPSTLSLLVFGAVLLRAARRRLSR